MKRLVDMNLSPSWVRFFAANGVSAQHWSAIGAAVSRDAVIAAHARDNGLVILTQDLDFGTILASSRAAKPSVVQIRADDTMPDAIGSLVLDSLAQCAAELEGGAIVTIDSTRVRVSVLPLGH